MKDLGSQLPPNLEIAVLLERIDARDAFIGNKAKTLDELPNGARVGTSSLRRQSQILARRPDLHVVPLRGNVDTRLRKLAEGIADATLLAVAGLKRLGAADRISSIMEMDMMLPAAAQGAIGIETRKGDDDLRKLLAPLNCAETFTCISAERALLKVLDGSCRTPIAAYAHLTTGGQIKLDALVAKPDGTELLRMEASGAAKDAETIGADLGHKFKGRLPADFFKS
jgi:hydroxymethylbilane synthase